MTRPRDGQPGRDELLDHDTDGIKEFDNALPRWWLYGFYFTIVFAAVYLVNYHVLPRPVFGHAGMVAEYQAELAAASRESAVRKPAAVSGDMSPLTDAASLAEGKAIFEGPTNLCISCHRADLGGLVGPNLTDGDWLHGCGMGDVVASIKTGYPLKGMLPYGVGKPLTDQQVRQVASYVLSKRRSSPVNPKPRDPERDKPCG
ncbi:MAG: cytochrome c oxidase cbb3-type subunit [Acidobacteriota bacterium]|jgi:cytochrome c oxidase cbb3-type subunit 3